MRMCNAESQKRSAKGSKIKKTTGLCPCRSYYSMVLPDLRGVEADEHSCCALQDTPRTLDQLVPSTLQLGKIELRIGYDTDLNMELQLTKKLILN